MIRTVLVAAALGTLVGLTAIEVLSPPLPVLIWNASPSVPVGLYRVTPARKLTRGDLVAIAPNGPLADFLSERGYLPPGVPLLKHVRATSGQQVCRSATTVSVDGVALVTALERDRRGHPLPVWGGCITLGPDQFFALNPAALDSLDGRYFGPLQTSTVIGQLHPLWLPQARGGGR